MNIELNEELIRRNNNQSMFDRGNHIKESANMEYKKFIETYSKQNLNNKQLEIVNKRKEQFKELLTNEYNNILKIEGNYVPITVSGPAKYPAKKMMSVLDKIQRKYDEFDNKIDKFYKNTDDMLKSAYTKDEIIKKYRNGYNEPISNDDPLVKEKLEAKLEYLEEKHNKYKDYNKKARKEGLEQLAPYVLANSNQNIKSVKDRLANIEKMQKFDNTGFTFKDGEVKFDKEDMRVKIFFNNKPSEEVRTELKSHAFKWSPKNMAWQRKLTNDSIYMTNRIFKGDNSIYNNITENKEMRM